MQPMATHDTPPTAEQWHQQYPSSPRYVSMARRQVGDVMEKWGYGELDLDRVLLVCGELAANAVQHGRTPGRLFEVRVTVADSDCLVEVSDSNRRRPEPRTADAYDERGRGLTLVAALSKETGHHSRDPVGKTVWARLELSGPGRERDV